MTADKGLHRTGASPAPPAGGEGKSTAASGALGHFRELSGISGRGRVQGVSPRPRPAPPRPSPSPVAAPQSPRVGHGVPVAAAADEAGDHLPQERPAHLHLRLLGELPPFPPRQVAAAPPCRDNRELLRLSPLPTRCRALCCWPWASGVG